MENHSPSPGPEQAPLSKVPSAPVTAMVSLVFGILSVPGALACVGLPAAVPAIVCGHLARRQIRQSKGHVGGRGIALAGLITGYAGLLISLAMFGFCAYWGYHGYKIAAAYSEARHDDCGSRLQQVCLACDCYADDNNETYPPDFTSLYKTYLPDAKALVCADSKHAAATTIEALTQAQYQDFVYFGAGIRRDNVTEKTKTILAAERPGHHADKKMTVVFCDGHTETFTGDNLETIIKEKRLLLPSPETGKKEGLASTTENKG